MAGATPKFGLAYFDFGDDLSEALNVRKEIERFTIIDRQMFGITSIFGDGVVSGWTVEDGGGLSLRISAGVGIYEGKALESFFSTSIQDVSSSDTLFVYAIPGPTSSEDRYVVFKTSSIELNNGLLIAIVTTGGTNIESIDMSVRAAVGFKGAIAEEIAQHRHNGAYPKIDLTQEVQGQLPTSRMADLDASKINGGKLPASVLPTIEHSRLKNTGVLTHPQIDSIVQSIQKDNIALLGEVASINLMKMIAYMKYLDCDVDQYFVNELCVVPGISSNDLIDFDNSNAHISLDSHCISGIPELPIEFSSLPDPDDEDEAAHDYEIVNIHWETDAEFRNEAVSISDLAISDGVRLSVDTTKDLIIEQFEGAVGGTVPSYGGTVENSNTVQVVYDSSSAQGDTSARFEAVNSRSAEFIKSFGQPQDWGAYDTLVVFVKNYAVTHAGVTLTLYNALDVEIASFILLTPDETTTESNLDTDGFAKKEFDISTFTRTSVKKLVMSTSTITNETEAFYVDTIYLSSNDHLLPNGSIRLRKTTTAPVIFNSVDYAYDLPAGTDIQVRVRVAASENELPLATYSSLLQPNETFSLPGRVCEIEITLLSLTGTATPTLDEVNLSILVPAQTSGLTIASASAWNEALDKVNIEVIDTGDDTDTLIKLKNTSVGNFHFINNSQVSELDPNGLPVAGIIAQAMPIAPAQGEHLINPPTSDDDAYSLVRNDTRGLYKPLSSYRLTSGNFMIADTYNDRVMEIAPDGVFVRGWGAHCYDTNADSLYALTSCYNPRLGVLFITFSRTTDIRNFDLTDIRVVVGGTKEIRLSNESDKVRYPDGSIITDRTPGADTNNPPANGLGDTERILTIFLSADKRAILDNTVASVQVSVTSNIKDRIECFIGDFTYFGSFGIHRPIYANMSGENTVIVANASIISEFNKAVRTFPILEFTRDIGELVDDNPVPLGLTFSYDALLFSDIMLGSLQVINGVTEDGEITRRLLIAGIKYNQTAAATAAGSSAAPATVLDATFSPLDDKKMQLFTGVVRLIDMDSQLVMFEYICSDGKFPSDAFIDDDGNVVVAESSFTSQSGRIITLDVTGIGDGATPPITKLIEGGVYTKIWDIRKLKENHIYVST